jgi:hypothetical protein
MNIRHLPQNTDLFTVITNDLSAASQPIGTAPGFRTVGRPWRYEFPHQPSTSDPNTQPRFTVQAPVVPVVVMPVVLVPVVLVPVQVLPGRVPESAAIPPSASPPAADPADQSQIAE